MLSKRILTLVSLLLISSLLVGCLFITPEVAVTGVTLDQETLALVAGGATGTLVETVEPADAIDPSVIWASSDEAVATVDAGVVTPLAEGTADITVTTVDGGFTATCVVTVTAAEEPPVAVTGVTLDEATLALTIGDAAVTLVETVEPVDATDPSVTWASSDESVAIVALGVVTPLNAGISAITVTTVDGGFVATCVVTVSAVEPEPNQAPVITSTAITSGKVGLTYTYDVDATDPDGDDLTYSLTENPLEMTIVAITGEISWDPTDAGVFGVGVKVSDPDGLFDVQGFNITVVEADEPEPEPELVLVGIVVDPEEMDLYVGEEEDITSVTATYEIRGYDVDVDFDDCLFLTSDSEVATVSGVTVTAEGAGTADIVVSYEGKIDTIEVTVIAVELDHITVNPEEMEFQLLGNTDTDSQPIESVTAYYDDGSTGDIAFGNCTYLSDYESVATVDGFGVVTPLSTGETTITVSYTEEGITKTDTIEVTVYPNLPPVITLIPDATVKAGDAFTCAVVATDPEGDDLTYDLTTVPMSLMVIDGDGEITWTPELTGDFEVTVEVSDGKLSVTQEFTITVEPGDLASFTISVPSTAIKGEAFDVTVTAYDGLNNIKTDYVGIVAFTSDDATATLPADYTFLLADSGVHTFPGEFTLNALVAGPHTITVEDTILVFLETSDVIAYTLL